MIAKNICSKCSEIIPFGVMHNCPPKSKADNSTNIDSIMQDGDDRLIQINRECVFHHIIELIRLCRIMDGRARYDVELKAWVIEIPDKEPK